MEGWTGLPATVKLGTYCACMLYVTLGITTVPQTAIFNESSTLLFSAVTLSTPVIFSQVSLKLMRILHDKNEQNWSSRFGETCIVLILRSDRYSVRVVPRASLPHHSWGGAGRGRDTAYPSELASISGTGGPEGAAS